jgi:hypothetical protein
MDPIGTVRREDHEDEPVGYSIWLRQDPGYPDSEMRDTEWTCIWSTSPGNIGVRHGDDITTCSRVIGAVPGTPAQTAADVRLDDRVETLPGGLYWTDEPVQGTIVAIVGRPDAHCTILFDEPQQVPSYEPGEPGVRYTHWAVSRLNFRILEEDFS